MRIDSVSARSVIDTRGRATIEATLVAQQGSTLNPNPQGRTLLRATASVPSGKSTGYNEALELRDIDGSVTSAIASVNCEIAKALTEKDFASPDELDELLIALDGTPNKSRLGANAILSVSIATQRLFAQAAGVPLWKAISQRAGTTPANPRLFVNVMEGGVHADFKLPFQEYLLVVEGTMGTALPIAQEAFAKIGERLRISDVLKMGDEGGYSPTFDTLEKPLELLADIVIEFPGTSIALDIAANELFSDDKYHILGKAYSADELLRLYEDLVAKFPIHSIEDPFSENAPADFARLTAVLGGPSTSVWARNILVVGDDLTVTNSARIEAAVSGRQINAVIIKPNQIGTVKEALDAVRATQAAGWQAIASHRSGETADTFIADFAYGVGAYGIKAGGFGQSERVAKYNRLRAIEREAEAV